MPRTLKKQAVPPEDLSLKMIRDKIPKEMFKQNTAKSMAYLGRDLVQVAVTFYVFYTYGLALIDKVADFGVPTFVANIFKFAMWNLYWYVQGLNGTALWVLAHECGHRAFSSSKTINDTVGMIVHSALLVPYHSWRISHANHHKYTNHCDLDTVFVPPKVEKGKKGPDFSEAPIVTAFWVVIMWTLGWPMYLAANVAGQKYNRRANHFEPRSPLFRPSEGGVILESDIGLAAWGAFLATLVFTGTFTAYDIFLWYFLPYMWVNFWLVTITYLQHTDTRLPHYDAENWNFVRGALCTVDRDFGWLINPWIHHINDSHVVHHAFSDMPFYNAIVVTRKYLKDAVPAEHYVTDDRSVVSMVWDSWRNCRWVRPSDGIAWFHQ